MRRLWNLALLAPALVATGCIIVDDGSGGDLVDGCSSCAAYQDCLTDEWGGESCGINPAAVWQLTIGTLQVAGTEWDALGDLPDPVVCVSIGGGAEQCTQEASNMQGATYGQSTQFFARDLLAAPVRFRVVDVDIAEDDVIGTFDYQFTEADLAKLNQEQAFQNVASTGIASLSFTLSRL